jgi:4-amino-4-deoxy-L-arabinose transferase-like glycosyltransferase
VTTKSVLIASNTSTRKAAPVIAEYKQARIHIALVFLTIGIGCFLRIYNFWIPPIWIDEYGTWWVVAADNWVEVIERALRIQGQSPFYYLLVKAVTQIGGYGAFQLRLVSIIFGVFTLCLTYFVAWKIFDNELVALLYLILVALSEPFIWYSQIARPYALALFFSLLSFCSFLCLQKNQTIPVRIIFILSTVLTVYAHYLFGTIVIIQVVYLIVSTQYSRLLLRSWLVNGLALVVLVAPLSVQLMHLHHRRHALDWMASVDAFSKTGSVIIYIIGGASPIAILATSVVIAVMGSNWQALKRREIRLQLTLPVLWYTLPLLLFLIVPSIAGVTLIHARYMLFGYPAMYLLFAWLMLNLRGASYHKLLPATVFLLTTIVFVSVPALSSTRTFARWPNRAWNDALANLPQVCTGYSFVVAQVGLVEADELATNPLDVTLLSYLRWPVRTTFPAVAADNIGILPYRYTSQTQSYFNSLLNRAVKQRRICTVGGEAALLEFRDQLLHIFNYKVTSQSTHGDSFHVYVFEKPQRKP